MKDWIFHKNIVSQISKNRWSEGIYDISLDSIISDKVKINQGQVPIIVKKQDFNSLEIAWIKAKEEYNDKISSEDSFSDIGYDIIVEFMTPNLLFDRNLTLSNQRSSIKQVPRSKGVVLERELIVDANIRITEDVLQKLNSLTIAIDNQNKGRSLNNIWNYLGRDFIIDCDFIIFYIFIHVQNRCFQ